jgi:hypothetical protein
MHNLDYNILVVIQTCPKFVANVYQGINQALSIVRGRRCCSAFLSCTYYMRAYWREQILSQHIKKSMSDSMERCFFSCTF